MVNVQFDDRNGHREGAFFSTVAHMTVDMLLLRSLTTPIAAGFVPSPLVLLSTILHNFHVTANTPLYFVLDHAQNHPLYESLGSAMFLYGPHVIDKYELLPFLQAKFVLFFLVLDLLTIAFRSWIGSCCTVAASST